MQRRQAPAKHRWNVYPGYPNRKDPKQLRVTLNAKGVFLINTPAYKAMKEPAAVEFCYDEDTHTVGLTPTDPRNVNAFPVKGKMDRKKYRYHIIHGAPFCKHYGFTPDRTKLFIDIDLDNDGTLTLELRSMVTVGKHLKSDNYTRKK